MRADPLPEGPEVRWCPAPREAVQPVGKRQAALFGRTRAVPAFNLVAVRPVSATVAGGEIHNFRLAKNGGIRADFSPLGWISARLRRSRPPPAMSALRVRREKAALSSGCKSHPANAPAGSNRSSHGGDEMGLTLCPDEAWRRRWNWSGRRWAGWCVFFSNRRRRIPRISRSGRMGLWGLIWSWRSG